MQGTTCWRHVASSWSPVLSPRKENSEGQGEEERRRRAGPGTRREERSEERREGGGRREEQWQTKDGTRATRDKRRNKIRQRGVS
eukprot:1459353-Rhodomonas_salina.1